MNQSTKIIEVWLVRHGESEVNKMDRSRFTGSNLWSELTDSGRHQAIQLGYRWKGIYFSEWFCSPAVRAQQTARYCIEGMSDDPVFPQAVSEDKIWPTYKLVPAFVEQSQGEAEGKLKIDFEYQIIDKLDKKPRTLTKIDRDEDWWIARPFSKETKQPAAGSETQKQVFERATAFLRNKLEEMLMDWQPNMRIVIFTHEVVIKCICSKLENNTLSFKDIFIGHTSVVKLACSDIWKFIGFDGEARVYKSGL